MKIISHRGTLLPYSVVFLLLLSTSCSYDSLLDDPSQNGDSMAIRLSARIEQNSVTRADDSGFANGDRIGLYVVNSKDGMPGQLALSGNHIDNVAMTYNADNGGWNAATDLYWLDNTTLADFVSYYPYNSSLKSIENQPFTVESNQNTEASGSDLSGYEASDFLWAKADNMKPGERVDLTFRHIMAGVKVILTRGAGFTDDSWNNLERIVTVDNTIRSASINLSNGEIIPDGTFDRPIVMSAEPGDVYRAVAVPQSVEAGKSTIGITIDGHPYKYTRQDGMKYTSGRLHTFTIEVNKNTATGDYSLRLKAESIEPWESDASSHDFEANSYFVVNVENAGTLKDVLRASGANCEELKNLKVIGQLTDSDYQFMREEMPKLAAVNLKDSRVVHSGVWNWETQQTTYYDDRLPTEAFYGKNSLHRIILPENLRIIGNGALRELTLASDLIIPETVTEIENWGVSLIYGDFGSLSIPSGLEILGDFAFCGVRMPYELKLSNKLRKIGDGAFQESKGAHGTFQFPQNLEYIGVAAFEDCGHDLVGDITIPAGTKEIPAALFKGLGLAKGTNLTLPEGLKKIGKDAFVGISFSNPLILPESLEYIDNNAFKYCKFAGGTVRLPAKIKYIGRCAFSESNLSGTITFPSEIDSVIGGAGENGGAFSYTQIEKLIIGSGVLQIENNAFSLNRELKYVELGKNVEYIGESAFNECPNIQTVVALAATPPKLHENNFNDCYMDKVVLEVPEKSIALYRNAAGWKKFRNITAHRELAFNITDISCLDKGVVRKGIIRAEGPWSVAESPSWIHVSPNHADYKEELTVTVDPLPSGASSREGKIVFRLDGKEYSTYTTVRQKSYDYGEDKEIILQQASAGGKEIPVFIVGEGFDADLIVSGEYMNRMKAAAEYLFAIEPFKSYRNYFTVTTSIACSPEAGTGNIEKIVENKFNTDDVRPSVAQLRNYVRNVSSHAGANMSNALIIVITNLNAFSGWYTIENDGCSIASIGIEEGTYPYDQRGLIQHYAGGSAFAGLGVEFVGHFEHIKGCTCPGCNDLSTFNEMKKRGFFENLTLSAKINEAPWKDFIFMPRYSLRVDMWEGGFNHLRGVWRSEANSVMNTFIPYYNTISRYAIYKQIMRRSGRNASPEDFIANDKIELPDE